MKIKTKYKVGDTFWTICRQTLKPKEHVIYKITITIDMHSKEEYLDAINITVNAKDTFSTKNDLINSL